MKKAFLTLCFVMLTAVTVFAGGDGDRYLNAKGSQNWFIDASVTGSLFQSNDFSFKNFGPFHGPFIGASGKVGKMITPCVGLRLAYDMHPCKNHHAATVGYFSYKNLHFDVMLSLFDILGKVKTDRVYRMYLYGGTGLLGYDSDGSKLFITSKSALELGGNLGLMNSIRLSNSLDLHLDLQATVMRWSFDEFDHPYRYKIHSDLEAMLGFTYFLGGRHFESVEYADCDDACLEQEAQIEDLENEIAELRETLANVNKGDDNTNKPCDTVYKFVNVEGKMISYPFSIFFNKGSYELKDGRDRVNLQEIANVAKKNGYKITLRGSCDSGTASNTFNKTLAENRCRKVKDELVKLGIAEKDITIDAVGGVKELTPAEYDRRVLINLVKE